MKKRFVSAFLVAAMAVTALAQAAAETVTQEAQAAAQRAEPRAQAALYPREELQQLLPELTQRTTHIILYLNS